MYEQKQPYQKTYYPKKEEKDPELAEFYKPFAISLNPDAPDDLNVVMEKVSNLLNNNGYTVRLGGNKGLEEIPEQKFTRKELHLPWRGFNEKESKSTFNAKEAYVLAKQCSPVYDKLPDVVKAFLARNVRLILGRQLNSPLLFLITWSKDGCEAAKNRSIKTGNVGHVIAMADLMHVPVFNLANENAISRLESYVLD